MKITISQLSIWAARHPRQTAALIIIIEVTNIFIGIAVGSAVLNDFSPWVLMALVASVVLLNVNLKRYAHVRLTDMVSKTRFGFQKQLFFGLFCLNLCAYTLAGGIMGRMIDFPESAVNSYGSLNTTVSETASDSKKMSFRETMQLRIQKRNTTGEGDTGKRIGYIGLFVLGLALGIAGAYLACVIACGGYGFAAILMLLLAIGVFAGGLYFLGRVIDKNMKSFKEMTRDERKRESRRYGRTLLGTVGGIALLILLTNLGN